MKMQFNSWKHRALLFLKHIIFRSLVCLWFLFSLYISVLTEIVQRSNSSVKLHDASMCVCVCVWCALWRNVTLLSDILVRPEGTSDHETLSLSPYGDISCGLCDFFTTSMLLYAWVRDRTETVTRSEPEAESIPGLPESHRVWLFTLINK